MTEVCIRTKSSLLLSVTSDKPFISFSTVFKFSHTLRYFSPTRGFYSVTTLIQPSAQQSGGGLQQGARGVDLVWEPAWGLVLVKWKLPPSAAGLPLRCAECQVSSSCGCVLSEGWKPRARGRRTWSCFKHTPQLDYWLEVMPWEHDCGL